MNYEIRTATKKDLPILSKMAANEGWNPGLKDMEAFYAQDPEGFLVGCIENKPVTCISVVKYPDNFAFLGFYIAAPEVRGTGLGLQIWNKGMDRLADCDVGLDGVVDQQDNYRKSGFELAWQNCRYQGVGGGVRQENVREIKSTDSGKLHAFDKKMFGFERETFLEQWSTQEGHICLGYFVEKELTGYGVIRECIEGYKIGPLFANDSVIAESLFESLKALVPEATIYLDIPLPNKNALALVNRHQMTAVFETARMYKGKAPELPIGNIYGVTSFELG